MATEATTVGAASITVFHQRGQANRRTWTAHRPLLQLLASEDISQARIDNKLRMVPIRNELGKAEAYKWYLGTTAPTGGGSYSPGATFTFNNQTPAVPATVTLAHYQQTTAFPASRIDVHAPARDNENGVALLVRLLEDARKSHFDRIARHIVQTSPAATDIETLVGTGTISGVLGDGITIGKAVTYGVDSAVETGHRSIVHDLGNTRLTLRRLAKDIRDARRNRAATIDVIICGSSVHNDLVQEWEALGYPQYDLVTHFGTNPTTSQPRLFLEASHSVIKVEGAPVIPDTDLDVTAPGRALGLSLGEIELDAGEVNNMTVEGWEKVRITAGVDQVRAMILHDLALVVFDRSKFVVWHNIAN